MSRRGFLTSSAAAGALAIGGGTPATANGLLACESASMGEFLAFDDQFAVINNDWSSPDAHQRVHLYDDGTYGWEFDRDGQGSGPNYPEVSFGCRPWGAPTTQTNAFPVQRGNLNQFEVSLDVDVNVTSGDEWNLALEWWLTEQKPGAGSDVSGSITHEIMVVLEWGSGHGHGWPNEEYAFQDAYGNDYDYWTHYTDHGDQNWSFHIFRISANQCPGAVDLGAVMDYLDDHVHDSHIPITDDLWVNGVETGNEYWPYTAGSTTIRQYDVTANGTTARSGQNVSIGKSTFDVDSDCTDGSSDGSTDDGDSTDDGGDSTDGSVAIAVDAGGSGHQASDGTYYESDSYYANGSTTSTGDAIANTDDDALYKTERWGDPVSYDLPVENGTYDVELHFAEIYWSSSGERVFDASVEGQTVVSNLDIYSQVGDHTAMVETVTGVDVTDGSLTVDLNASSDNAKLSAVKVVDAGSSDSTDDSTDDTAPSQPSNLTVDATRTNEVDLSWGSVSDASRYNVYVDGSWDHDTTDSYTTVGGLSSGTSYEFGVTAVDSSGNESSMATVTGSTGSDSTDDSTDDGSSSGDDNPHVEIVPSTTTASVGETVAFDTDTNTDWITDMAWDMDDGTTYGSDWYVTHSFDSAGTYYVSLETESGHDGSRTTDVVAIEVS